MKEQKNEIYFEDTQRDTDSDYSPCSDDIYLSDSAAVSIK